MNISKENNLLKKEVILVFKLTDHLKILLLIVN